MPLDDILSAAAIRKSGKKSRRSPTNKAETESISRDLSGRFVEVAVVCDFRNVLARQETNRQAQAQPERIDEGARLQVSTRLRQKK